VATLSTYWSPSDLQSFRQALIDQHRVLLEQWSAAKHLHDAERIGHEAHWTESDADVTRLGGEVAAFERALKRLYRGVFGVCIHCHQDIAASRMRAHPAAAYCRSCECAHEQAVAHPQPQPLTTI
jgi:RNA polymerase-binding transcription factor DksA